MPPALVRTFGRCTAVLSLTVVPIGACAGPAVSWIDDAPVATADPSPLAQTPAVAIDSAMRDGAPTAALLALQDLLRETNALALLAPRLATMAESRGLLARNGQAPSMSGTPMPGTPMPGTPMPGMPMPGTPVPEMSMPGMSMPPVRPEHALGDGDMPTDSVRCARSFREALAPGRGRVAVWWSRRERGRVLLLAAWRDTVLSDARLGAWRGPIIVDSLDQGPRDAEASARGSAACSRPAPSLVVDDTHGYVHVGYALTGPEGPGVFYAHQMDPRAGFETPQAIVYGDRLGAVRVAASGDVVAVAYDDPNGGERPRIGLAVSRTSGHTFEDRLIASSKIANARDPHVLLQGRAIVVGWSEFPTGGGDATFRIRRAVVR